MSDWEMQDTRTLESIEQAVWQIANDRLTKRERFAMAAMQGILAAVYAPKHILEDLTASNSVNHRVVSQLAVSFADAVIAELEKEKG